jgi:hypothetical protein
MIISANLSNNAVISKSFTISEWPDWLVPSVTSATILSENDFTIQLKAVEALKPGLYTGQVVAMVDDVPEILNVTLELYAKDINWWVNTSVYEFNMNITAQFSTDDGDLNLSEGIYDKIAAYINGELRGVGEIEFVPSLNKYAAFINVFNNQSGNNGSWIEAEDYVDDKSVREVDISDNGINSEASVYRTGYWTEYDIYATKDGSFDVDFRLAGTETGKEITLLVDGTEVQTFMVPNTGNLNTYATVSTTIAMSAGSHKLRILSKNAQFYLNWFNFPQYHVRNEHATNVMTFRMWDGLNGIEYGAVEELTFFSDGVVGNAQDPFILHPAGGVQDMMLAKGWTWISVNKESDDMSVDKTFESITSPSSLNEITLKSQTGFSQYSKNAGWQGNLSNMDVRAGYMIYLSAHDDTLSMIGISPASDIAISLNPKWNWIGYPKSGLMGAGEVLALLSSSSGDIIKSQFEFAEYNENTNSWIGDLKFFEPGKGYKLFVSNADNLNIKKSGNPDELYLKHEYNMTLTATINFGELLVSDDYSLQTYIKNELRGEIPLKFVNGLNQYMAFNMIYGDRADIGEEVNVVLWDNYNQRQLDLTSPGISFGIDKIAGTINNPVVLSALSTGISGQNPNSFRFVTYPNPFSKQTLISYFIPTDSHVVLTITDSFGKEVITLVDDRQTAGEYDYTFEAGNQASGIYFCNLKTDDDVETKKLILMNK